MIINAMIMVPAFPNMECEAATATRSFRPMQFPAEERLYTLRSLADDGQSKCPETPKPNITFGFDFLQ